jgi:hypothetical protein
VTVSADAGSASRGGATGKTAKITSAIAPETKTAFRSARNAGRRFAEPRRGGGDEGPVPPDVHPVSERHQHVAIQGGALHRRAEADAERALEAHHPARVRDRLRPVALGDRPHAEVDDEAEGDDRKLPERVARDRPDAQRWRGARPHPAHRAPLPLTRVVARSDGVSPPDPPFGAPAQAGGSPTGHRSGRRCRPA